MTGLVCILLGCGIPTTANYIIMVTVAAPTLGAAGRAAAGGALLRLLLRRAGRHHAAGGAGAPMRPRAWPAAIRSRPATWRFGSAWPRRWCRSSSCSRRRCCWWPTASRWSAFVITFVGCVLGITLLAAALSRFMVTELERWEQGVLVAAALLTIAPGLVTTLIGLAIASPVLLRQWARQSALRHRITAARSLGGYAGWWADTQRRRSTPSPSRSIAGGRLDIASASTRAEPQASAQPLEPWPRLSHTPGMPLAPITGGPSGNIGRAPFQLCALACTAAPGNQSSSHLVQRGQGSVVGGLQRAAQLGATGHAHALAEAADGDLVALVDQRRARADVAMLAGFAQRRGHRVAVHRGQRQAQFQRRKQLARRHCRAHHHRIELLAAFRTRARVVGCSAPASCCGSKRGNAR